MDLHVDHHHHNGAEIDDKARHFFEQTAKEKIEQVVRTSTYAWLLLLLWLPLSFLRWWLIRSSIRIFFLSVRRKDDSGLGRSSEGEIDGWMDGWVAQAGNEEPFCSSLLPLTCKADRQTDRHSSPSPPPKVVVEEEEDAS